MLFPVGEGGKKNPKPLVRNLLLCVFALGKTKQMFQFMHMHFECLAYFFTFNAPVIIISFYVSSNKYVFLC